MILHDLIGWLLLPVVIVFFIRTLAWITGERDDCKSYIEYVFWCKNWTTMLSTICLITYAILSVM